MKKKLVFKKVTKGTETKKSHMTRPQLYAKLLTEYEPLSHEDMIDLMTDEWKKETGKDVRSEIIGQIGRYEGLLTALGIMEKGKDGTIKYLIEE
ncbi:MAG: hypothetical protein PHC68_00665 [Syntrophorhabdaceae bacterium]|nr:hypothetical protein [Syntrophorhabdaceae bacterium]